MVFKLLEKQCIVVSKIKKPLLASLIVTQANELVESRYNLTLGEQQYLRQKLGRPGVNSADFCGLENSVVD